MSESHRRHLTLAPRVTDPAAEAYVDEASLLQVGDLAKATGKTVRAIHLYEDLGLIEPVRRSAGRYRLFSPDAKVRVSWISKLQSLGLSLTEIQAIVERRHSSESARRASEELCEVYARKLAEVRDTIRQYRALEVELEASVAFLEGCKHSCEEVATSGCAVCSRHAEPITHAPELVVGAQLD